MTKGVPVTTAIQKELGVEELAWNNDDVYLAEDLIEMTGQEIEQGSRRPSLRPPRRRRLPNPAIPWEGAMTMPEVFTVFHLFLIVTVLVSGKPCCWSL